MELTIIVFQAPQKEDPNVTVLREAVKAALTAYMSHWGNPDSTKADIESSRETYNDARADYLLYTQLQNILKEYNVPQQ